MTQDQLESRIAIEDLFSRYMWAIDCGDVAGVAGCFTEDGSLESPAVGAYSGRDQITAFAERFARFRERGSQLRHVISNLMVDIDGDTATAQCYLVVFIVENGDSRLLGPGRYECDLRRVDGAWYFARRLVVMDHDYELKGI